MLGCSHASGLNQEMQVEKKEASKQMEQQPRS